jgi:outer membrane protein assembly factor BamA
MQNCVLKFLLILCCVLNCAVIGLAQQSQAASSFQLGNIDFVGLKKYDRQQITTASELKPGQAVTVEAIDAAARKLAALGYFRRVNYRYQVNGKQLDVTFEVDEGGGIAPVVFDNFAGFTDREIIDEVRKEIPSFDGNAPEADDIVQKIDAALERMLQKRGLPNQVEYSFSVGSQGVYRPEHVFTIKDVRLTICQAIVTNTASVPVPELLQAAQALVGSEYSRINARGLAELEVGQVFRKYGHLRVKFGLPNAELDLSNNQKCKGGVILTLPAEPGPAYRWEKAVWIGNQALPATTLDTSLAMKPGEIANGQQLDAGFREVFQTYNRRGHLLVRIMPTPEFDDASKRVTAKVIITEGPQFRQGSLTVLGIPEAEAKRVRERWQLKTGDVYDAAYLNGFMQKIYQDGIVRFDPSKKLNLEAKPDQQKLTVDVTINFDAKVQ